MHALEKYKTFIYLFTAKYQTRFYFMSFGENIFLGKTFFMCFFTNKLEDLCALTAVRETCLVE